MLPNNPVILLSFINTKLRDIYSNLDLLCEDMDVSKKDIIDKLEQIGYVYDEKLNQFV